MAITLVSALSVDSVQSIIYVCGAACLLLLPMIDAVLAQVSTAMLVLLALGHVMTQRKFAKEEADRAVPTGRRPLYEKHEYVPPNREWSRRTRYKAMDGTGTKKCNSNLFHRGYMANDDTLTTPQAGKPCPDYAETPVPKYHELLSAGAKPAAHLSVTQRKIHRDIIPEEDAKRLLEKLHELEMRLDHRRNINGEKTNSMPRRMAAGIRDAVRAMQRGRAQAIVIASDAGADSRVADLMAQASWKGVPVMVALPRAQLGKMIVRADITATVLVILHAEGCEDLFEEVTGKTPQPPRSDPTGLNEPVGEESNVAARARTEPAVEGPGSYPWKTRTSNVSTPCATPSSCD